MKCFYHSADLDGHCSGELIRRAHPDCELIGINYGDTFPWDTIEAGETVYMVDFALQPWSDMQRLAGLCDLVWIDHHKSAIEENTKAPISFRGTAVSGLGACAMVYDWLRQEEKSRPEVPSKAVTRLAEYDVWNHSHPDTLPFQYGIRMYDTMPGTPIWDRVFSLSGYAKVVAEGEIVLRYQAQQNIITAKSLCFETTLDGLRCIAANKGMTNSQLFDSVWDPEQHDAMLTFCWRKGQWTISLYSTRDDVDVSKVAKVRGGGGHRSAAGFQCDDLPFAPFGPTTSEDAKK